MILDLQHSEVYVGEAPLVADTEHHPQTFSESLRSPNQRQL